MYKLLDPPIRQTCAYEYNLLLNRLQKSSRFSIRRIFLCVFPDYLKTPGPTWKIIYCLKELYFPDGPTPMVIRSGSDDGVLILNYF